MTLSSYSLFLSRALLLSLLLLGLSSCLDSSQENASPAQDVYDPEPLTKFPGYNINWTETTRSPVALYESGGLAAGGKLYVFGGYYNTAIQATTESYAFDPATEMWENLAPMPEAVTHAGQTLYEGKVYFAGGFLGNHPGPPTDHVWIYDIARKSWSAGPSLPEALGGGALVELAGQLHFFGGTFREGEDYLTDSLHHWVLDISGSASSWTRAAPLPTPRNHIAGATVGGKIYAIGGQYLGDEDNGNTQVVEAYDPETDSWQKVASLPKPLGHISAATFVYAEHIFVVMGVTQGRDKITDIIAYDPETNTWGKVRSMLGGRSATVAGVIEGQIVLATGNVAGGPLDTTWMGRWDGEE